MIDLVVSYARANRAMGERVVAGLQRAGYTVAVDRDAHGAARPIEEVAVEMREAQAFIPLVTDKFLVSPDARQTVRIALLYDQQIVPARLQSNTDAEAIAADIPVLIGTRYEERPNDLADILAQSVDLSHAVIDDADPRPLIDDAMDTMGAPAVGRRRLRDPAVAPLVDELERLKILPRTFDEIRALEANGEPVYDSYGFEKSPQSMLARWRQIEHSGSIRDFERFEDDYEDDPFFATLAAEAADNLRRRRSARIADLGLRAVAGSLFAGLIVWAATAYCATEACSGPRGVTTIAQPAPSTAQQAALAAARREAERFQRQVAQLTDENTKLENALKDARNALARRGSEPDRRPTPPPPSVGSTVDGDDLRRMASELSSARRAVADLRNEIQRRDRAIDQLRGDLEQGGRALQAREQEIAQLQRQLANATTRYTQPTGRAAVVVPSPRGASDGSGMERIMAFYADRFDPSAGRSGRYGAPVFTPKEIRMLQACLLKRTGRLSKVDGRWGVETTGALLGVTTQEADWVIDCVLES